MADQTGRSEIGADDAILTAWLDGELPPAERATLDRRLAGEADLRARLEVLRSGERAFGPAYAALLAAAPAERLAATFAGIGARPDVRRASRPMPRFWLVVAAALVIFAGGALSGYIASVLTAEPQPQGWRQVVAEYHALISPETIAVIAEGPAVAELAAIGERLTLGLDPDRLALPDADLRRAQLYDYNGLPLAQLVYVSPDGEPFALCIIANGRSGGEIAFEEREGSRIVYWYKDGYGYMLIGKATSREVLESYATDLAGRFG
jgi:anti-sigma factor RsiW